MDIAQKNKQFIISYYNEMAAAGDKKDLIEKYITDESLIGHIEFFEKAFPGYLVFAEEMTAEDNRVVVQARMKGIHTGYLGEIPPTGKEVDIPFVIRYEIENEKIVNHWMVSDQMILMQQIGIVAEATTSH